jgi:putative ABC transport system substrate-binding protein
MYANHHSYRNLRTGCTILTVLIILSLLLAGCAPPKAKVYRVGVLSGLSVAKNITDGMKSKMTELGYVEGTNITYDVQEMNVDIAAYQATLKKFVDDKVDLIITFPTEASLEAKAITQGTNIPVVFAFAQLEGTGLVNSVREPGGNITGVQMSGPEISLKRFEFMRQIAPDAKRIYVPYMKGYPTVAVQLEPLRKAAKDAGVTLIEAPIASPADVEADLNTHVSAGVPDFDGILTLVEPIYSNPKAFPALAKFAYQHKIPFGGGYVQMGEYSSLYGIGVDAQKMGQQVGQLADKILKGSKAGTLPVISPENYIIMDTKAAQQMGVQIPDSLLEQANKVIR